MIPHLVLCSLCLLQSCNKSLINQACSGPYWENIGPRSFLYCQDLGPIFSQYGPRAWLIRYMNRAGCFRFLLVSEEDIPTTNGWRYRAKVLLGIICPFLFLFCSSLTSLHEAIAMKQKSIIQQLLTLILSHLGNILPNTRTVIFQQLTSLLSSCICCVFSRKKVKRDLTRHSFNNHDNIWILEQNYFLSSKKDIQEDFLS